MSARYEFLFCVRLELLLVGYTLRAGGNEETGERRMGLEENKHHLARQCFKWGHDTMSR